MPFLKSYFVCLVKIAIAEDVIGILPIYLFLVKELPEDRKKSVLRLGLLTAFSVGLFFLFLGKVLLNAMEITIEDFQVGGGLILVLMGIDDLLGEEKKLRKPTESFSIVPLGIPLIIGPAVISTMMLLVDIHGTAPSLMAFLTMIFVTGLAFYYGVRIEKILGKNGIRVISKITMLLLIALGIKMIRMGVMAFIFEGR
ncbi:MarC family protein [bacterium]|nr:MarC family protein [bacterium]